MLLFTVSYFMKDSEIYKTEKGEWVLKNHVIKKVCPDLGLLSGDGKGRVCSKLRQSGSGEGRKLFGEAGACNAQQSCQCLREVSHVRETHLS